MLDALRQRRSACQKEQEVGGEEEEHLVGAGVLYPREEHEADR